MIEYFSKIYNGQIKKNMSGELKIIVAGPLSCGKSEIANILSNASKGYTGNYTPTIAVRILEFSSALDINGMQTSIDIQLWDTSGDEKYSLTWPAIAKDADGMLLVYNGYKKKDAQAIERYCRELGKELSSKQVLVVAHKIGESEDKIASPKLPKGFEPKIVAADAKNNFNEFQEKFETFAAECYQMKLKKIEEKEKQMLGETVQKKVKKMIEPKKEEKPAEGDISPEEDEADAIPPPSKPKIADD